MNKTFDIKRLGMVMRWEIITRWKYYVSATIGCIIGYSLYCFIMLHNYSDYGSIEIAKHAYLEKVNVFFIPMVIFPFYVMATCIFDIMKTKNSRESFLMLPANKIEKYVSCLLTKLLGCPVLLAFILVGTDIIQLAFSFIQNPGFHISITFPVLKEWLDIPMFTRMQERDFIFLSFFIFAHSFCTLGGTFYRKMASLLTFATGLVLFLALSYIVTRLAIFGLIHFGEETSYIASTIMCIFNLALSAFNYWASYKIFSRMQVICNKWINI